MCALGLKKHAVVICGDGVFRNGARAGGSRFGFPNLDRLRAGQTAGVLVDAKCQLRLYVNGVDQGRYSIDIFGFWAQNWVQNWANFNTLTLQV